jgi:hypothetical protein
MHDEGRSRASTLRTDILKGRITVGIFADGQIVLVSQGGDAAVKLVSTGACYVIICFSLAPKLL